MSCFCFRFLLGLRCLGCCGGGFPLQEGGKVVLLLLEGVVYSEDALLVLLSLLITSTTPFLTPTPQLVC